MVLASILNIFLGFIGVLGCFFFNLFPLAFASHVLHKKYSFWQLWAILAHINSFGLQNNCVCGNWTMSGHYKPLWAWQLKKRRGRSWNSRLLQQLYKYNQKQHVQLPMTRAPVQPIYFLWPTQLTVCHSLRVNLWSTDLFIMTIEVIWLPFIKYSLFNYTDKRVTLGELHI